MTDRELMIDCPRCGHCCPKPEHEPVAWMHTSIEDNIISHRPADLKRHPERWTALYSAPHPWVGLTDEEVDALQDFAYADDVEFIRHIEAKLKEKNGG